MARGLLLEEQQEAESFELNRRRKMKTIKNILATLVVVTVLSASTTFADGILVAGRDEQPTKGGACSTKSTKHSGILAAGVGILVAGFTGILVSDFTGILVAGATGNTNTNCGILISD